MTSELEKQFKHTVMTIDQLSNDSTDDEIIDFILNELAPPISNDAPFEGMESIMTSDRVESIIDLLLEDEILSKPARGFGSHGAKLRLLPKGKAINKKGGWIKYHQDTQAEKISNQQKQDYKEQLELEKTEREVEKLKYEESIRELDDEIKRLTKVNYALQNSEIIYRWIVGFFGLLGGLVLEHYFERLQWLIKHLV